MKIYVASSWRNEHQPGVVRALRNFGHEVYDFKNPDANPGGFHWSEIDPRWQGWDVEEYCNALEHPVANLGFNADMSALTSCDACVQVMPSGISASLEMGWAVGAGKLTAVYVAETIEPELMFKMCGIVTGSIFELANFLDGV